VNLAHRVDSCERLSKTQRKIPNPGRASGVHRHGQVKGAKNNYNGSREGLRDGLEVNKVIAKSQQGEATHSLAGIEPD
jgi:hypothetical protein